MKKIYISGKITDNANARKNRHIGELSHSDKEEKAHNAITYIIARYLRLKDFAITKSFTGYLFLRIKKEKETDIL